MSSRTNFLSIPPKRTLPLPELPTKIRSYISEHFRDTHPDAFARDIEELVKLRRWNEGKDGPEVHREVVSGLLRYYAQLSFLCTKFPPDIGLIITYHLPFPSPPFSFSPLSDPDAPISLSSLHYERASTLFNIAATYSALATAEHRSDGEGIKRALAYLQSAAGALNYLLIEILPLLKSPSWSLSRSSTSGVEGAAGYDMTPSFISTLQNFVLAQAQECFWQKAVLEGNYKNGIVGRLAMRVAEYYGEALREASEGAGLAAGFFPQSWIAHMSVKKLHFEAAAEYRISQEDLEKGRYGEEIARLQVADGLTRKAIQEARNGVADTVLSDLKSLAAVLTSCLKRAIRDNDLVYVSPIPPPSQLPIITPATMVKLTIPPEVSNSLEWVMKDKGGPLFSGLVPYGVHVALSVYDDRKDTLIRTELHGKKDELDAISATTLQSLGLPGAITALERPTGLPPALLKKAEEVYSEGGVDKVKRLIASNSRLAQTDATIIEETLDLLDQEAADDEAMLEKRPDLIGARPPSHEANCHLIDQINTYQETLTHARKSDADVREKWQQWEGLVGILTGGENALERYIPTSGLSSMTGAQLPPSVRALRSALEDLEDMHTERSRIVADAKRTAEQDDLRPIIVQEATRMAHGGSGDVKSEWFENVFEEELKKYGRFVSELEDNQKRQEELLAEIRSHMEVFLHERKEDSRVKHRETKLQEMELAYWKWREVIGNCEEGSQFYTAFQTTLQNLRESAQEWVYSRRVDVGRLTAAMHAMSPPSATVSPPVTTAPTAPPAEKYQEPPMHFDPPRPVAKAATFTIPLPSSGAWQSIELPPPPPSPMRQSEGGKGKEKAAAAPPPPPASTPGRVTRSSAAKTNQDVIPNPFQNRGPRKDHGVI